MIIWDIETGPLPDDELRAILPEFVAPPHPSEFDPSAVKTGNLKDAAKIKDKIDIARNEHQMAVANYGASVERARANHFADFKASAALSPITGRVLAIGFVRVEKGSQPEIAGMDPTDSESDILWSFWSKLAHFDREPFAGWNIHQFDLPFILRRCWKLGVEVPAGIRDAHDRYWDNRFIDLMVKFSAGQRGGSNGYVKLDTAAKFLGAGEKPDGCGGGDFAGLWLGSPAERERATEYLINDLSMTAGVARRMFGAAITK